MLKRFLYVFTLILFVLPNLAQAQASSQTAGVVTKEVLVNPEIDFLTNDFAFNGKAGLILSTGNTDSLNMNALLDLLYRIKRFENHLGAGGLYTEVYETKTGAAEGLSAEYLFAIYRLDYYLSQATTTYGGLGTYVDKVKGVDSAYQFFGGLSHWLLREPGNPTSIRVSGGYNFTHENLTAPASTDNIHSFEGTGNLTHLLTDAITLTLGVKMMENFEDLGDLRLNSDLELNFKMTKIFSLIAGWRLRFDNEPVTGFEKLDMIQDLSLGVTF